MELIDGFNMRENLSDHIRRDEATILILYCYTKMKHLKIQERKRYKRFIRPLVKNACRKNIFLFFNQNICFGSSKEQSK